MSDTTKRIRVVASYDGAALERGMHSASGGLDRFSGFVTRAAGALGALEVARRGLQLAETAQAAAGAQSALVAFSGSAEEAAANLEAVRRAAGGSISEMQAMATANRLLALNIVEGSAQMERFTRDALLLSKAMGMDAAEGLDNISASIANLSYVRLDQMGLSATAARERVAELTSGTNALSTEQAFAQAVMEQMAVKADALAEAGLTTANAFDQARTIIADFKLGIGDAINEAILPATESFGELNTALADNGLSWRTLADDALTWTLAGMGIVSAQREIAASLAPTTAEVNTQAEAAGWSAAALDVLAQAIGGIENPALASAASIAVLNGDSDYLLAVASEIPGGMATVEAAFYAAADAAGWTAEETNVLWEALASGGPSAAAAAGALASAGGAAVAMAGNMSAATQEVWALKEALDTLNNQRTGNYGRTVASGSTARTRDQREAFNVARTGQRGPSGLTAFGPDPREAAERERYLRLETSAINREYRLRAKAAEDAERAAREASRTTSRAVSGGARSASTAASKAAREAEAAAKKLQREQEKAAKEAAKAAERAAATVERAWMAAYSKVSSAVSRGMNLSTAIGPNDALLDQFGMRMEGPSEILRRLQDVVNRGDESEWARFYAEALGLGPGTGDLIKARAAQLMQEIEGGFRNDLIDREALKRNVRRELEGELMRAQLVDEVTRELLAEGYGTSEIERVLGPMQPDLSITPRLALEGATLAPLPETLIAPSDQLALSERMGTQMSTIMSEAGTQSGPAFVRSVIDGIAAGIEAQAGAIMARGRRMGELMADGIADAVAGVIVDRIADGIEALA